MNKTCIVIAGPTAVGKTSAAIEIATHFAAEIISSDSRQCYTELNIGVAKPSIGQLAAVPHHFINSHSIHDCISAADFEVYALDVAIRLFAKSDITVLVGGTGLYTKAFCEGLDNIPNAPLEYRNELKHYYQEKGISWLQREIAQKDPIFYVRGEMQNPQRMMRALEVMQASGKSILSYFTGEKKKRPFDVIKIGLELPREQLYENINARTVKMMDAGLLEEVESLHAWKDINPLQTVGYRELFAYLDGSLDLEKAVDLIKQNTRHYAKRQLTWFKRDADFIWTQPEATEKLISLLHKRLSS